jgi:hypothetical protein
MGRARKEAVLGYRKSLFQHFPDEQKKTVAVTGFRLKNGTWNFVNTKAELFKDSFSTFQALRIPG